MQRRTVLAGAAIALAGCSSGDSEPDGAEPVGTKPGDSVPPEVRGTWLEAESDGDVEVTDHGYRYTGVRTQPWVVSGTVVQSSGARATVKVSVTFLDEDGTAIGSNYDLVRELESDQAAEFTVQYEGDDPRGVDDYELRAEIQ